MTASRRRDLRPWARGVPKVVLQGLMLAALPIFVFFGMWDGGIKEALREWRSDWDQLRDLEPPAPRAPGASGDDAGDEP